MGSLLTLPAPALPFACREKEAGALVLFVVSAATVVVAAGTELPGVEDVDVDVADPPQAMSDPDKPIKMEKRTADKMRHTFMTHYLGEEHPTVRCNRPSSVELSFILDSNVSS
jgi:hypothetical protein